MYITVCSQRREEEEDETEEEEEAGRGGVRGMGRGGGGEKTLKIYLYSIVLKSNSIKQNTTFQFELLFFSKGIR